MNDATIMQSHQPSIFSWFMFISNVMLQVPARAEEITIPADVTPERVPTHIIDYCGKSFVLIKCS